MDLEATVNELAPQLLRFTLGVAGNRGLAEEAAQDALVALVQRWRKQGPPESPAAFAFAVARRRARRALWRRRWIEPLTETLGLGLVSRPHGIGEEDAALERLEARRTREALRRLGRRDREAILLAAAGELSMQEAADGAGISLSAFKMRLHRARLRLRALLDEDHARA